jgi:hypothetical protein
MNSTGYASTICPRCENSSYAMGVYVEAYLVDTWVYRWVGDWATSGVADHPTSSHVWDVTMWP